VVAYSAGIKVFVVQSKEGFKVSDGRCANAWVDSDAGVLQTDEYVVRKCGTALILGCASFDRIVAFCGCLSELANNRRKI
jgi:hypothetical protein